MKNKKKFIVIISSIVAALVCSAAIITIVILTRHKHSFGEWVEVTPATCTLPGELRRECIGCDKFETMKTEPLGHLFGDWYVAKQQDCAHEGVSQVDCVRCGSVGIASNAIPSTNNHTASEFYLMSDTTHYHICVNDCDYTSARLDETEHTFAPGSSSCSVCGYDKAMTECLNIQVNDSYCTVLGFKDSSETTKIVIPDFYNGLPVTTIAEDAFCKKTSVGEEVTYETSPLEKVYFGKNITSIGKRAFYKTSVDDLIFSENIKEINLFAFQNCESLTKIRFNEKLSAVGEQTFAYDSALTEVVIPRGISSIEKFAFYGCTELQSVHFGEDLTKINTSAFYGCSNLNNIEFNDALQEIGKNAFYNCTSLQNVNFGKNVTKVGDYAFYGCSNLNNIEFNDALQEIGEQAFINTKIVNLTLPDGLKSIGRWAFWNCSSIQSVHFGENVTKVDDYAFYNCSNLKTVEFNDGLQEIGEEAFRYTGIVELTLPVELKSVGRWAFNTCTSLQSVHFGDKLTEISNYVFYGCNNLSNVVFSDNLQKIGEETFSYTGLTELTLPAGLKTIGRWAFLGCPDLNTVYINDELSTISYSAFNICTSLQNVYFGKRVTKVDDYAFYGCKNLNNVEFNDGLQEIGEEAFEKTAIVNLTLPVGLKTIGNWAFCYCDKLQSVYFNDNLELVGDGAFSHNDKLELIDVGNSAVHLSYFAFGNCSQLTKEKVIFNENIKYVDNLVFDNCSGLDFYTDDQGVEYLGNSDNHFIVAIKAGNADISSFTAKEETYVIASKAFEDCSNLQTVVLNKNVHSIGSYAFGNCRQMTSLTFGSNIKFIREKAFSSSNSSNNIENVYVPSLKDWFNITFEMLEEGIDDSCNPLFSGARLVIDGATVEHVVVPQEITKISDYAFAGYEYLLDLTIGGQVTSIGNHVVHNCKNISGFNVINSQYFSSEGQSLIDTTTKTVIAGCKNSEIPFGVEHIAPYVFENMEFTTKEIVIPDSVLTIGDFSFAFTNLDKITFGKGLTTFGKWAFAHNGTHNIEVHITDLAAWCNIDFYDSGSLPFGETSKVYVGETLVSGSGNMLDLANITKVKSWAFHDAPIFAVHIPNETTFIGEGVFSGRIVLENIILDEGNTAFMLTADKTGLIYKGADGNVLIAVTNSVRDLNYKDEDIDVIGNSTFYGINIDSIILPDKLTKIEDFAFMYCYLTSVTLNENLKSIGESAFENCKLKNITIPASVTHIGYRAFMDCSQLTSASFDNTSNWWKTSDEYADVLNNALGCLKDGEELNNYVSN